MTLMRNNLQSYGNGPIKPGGTNFQGSKLVFGQYSIAVRMTWKFYFLLGFIAALFSIPIFIALSNPKRIEWGIFCVGAVVDSLMLFIIIFSLTRRNYPFFDLVKGIFYPNGLKRDDAGIPFNQLDHLQIVTEHCHSSKNSYDSYELNVVLKDGTRYNILDHGSSKLLLADAQKLSSRLSLKLVDDNTGEHIDSNQDDIKRKAAPMTKGAACMLLVFGMVFFSVGGFACWSLCIHPLHGWLISANWESLPAKIVSSELDSHRGAKGGATYCIHIQYVYKVDGIPYTGSRYDFFRSDMHTNIGVSKMRDIVSSMPKGKEITCLVNPKNPNDSVITREFPASNIFRMLFSLPFLGIGIFIIFSTIKALCLQKESSQTKSPYSS